MMKRIGSILFLALLVFSMAGGVLAKDEGPSISLDYGFCGYGNAHLSGQSQEIFAEKNYLTNYRLKFEYPIENLLIGIEYGNFNNPTYCSSFGMIDLTSWDGNLGIGYKVFNSKNLSLYVDLLYIYDSFNCKGSTPMEFTTNAFTVGPELRYAITDKISIQAFAGFSPVVSQKTRVITGIGIVDGGSINDLLNLYKLKINFAITSNIMINAGYYYKYIESHFDIVNSSNLTTALAKNSQSVTTLGLTYKF